MAKPGTTFGLTTGAIAAGYSIAINARGDAQLVSVFPNFVSLLIAPVFIYFSAKRWKRLGHSATDVRTASRQAALITSIVFTVLIAVFALAGPASYPPAVVAAFSGVAFLVTLATCHAAAALSGIGRS